MNESVILNSYYRPNYRPNLRPKLIQFMHSDISIFDLFHENSRVHFLGTIKIYNDTMSTDKAIKWAID